MLAWVVASFVVSRLAARGYNAVQPFGWDPDDRTKFFPAEDLTEMWLFGAAGFVFTTSMVGLAHVPLLRWRIRWPAWWSVVTGTGALASALVSFSFQGLFESTWSPDWSWGWMVIPLLSTAAARGGIEAFFLRSSVRFPALWLGSSVLIALIASAPGLVSAWSSPRAWDGAVAAAFSPLLTLLTLLTLLMLILPGFVMLRLTDIARPPDQGPAEA